MIRKAILALPLVFVASNAQAFTICEDLVPDGTSCILPVIPTTVKNYNLPSVVSIRSLVPDQEGTPSNPSGDGQGGGSGGNGGDGGSGSGGGNGGGDGGGGSGGGGGNGGGGDNGGGKPGHGHGDKNHGHSGPPGQNK